MSHSHFPYHPHHRSSEVFSEGFSTTTTAATSVKSTKANDDSTSDYLEISMVRPITIEDAIHRMQKVPSVEFACRFMKKHSIASSDICISASTATDHRNNNQFSAHSAALNKAFLNNKDISNEKSDKFCLETLPTQVLVHKPALYRNSTAHICNNNSRYGGSKQSNFEDNCNSITYQCADLITPKTCSNQICFNAPLTNIKSPSSTFGTVTTLTSATTPVLRCSSFSYRSNKNVIGNSGSNNNNNNISSNLAEFDHATRGSFSLRRATIARLGSDAADSEYYFVPKQSWLTSVYVKLPQSKSLRRIQLKLLNLPFFASVGRFLEETCTTTRSDQKAFLEDNSFLFAMFNQFVPHNRIPLNTLSQYVRRLQKYEILAIIEFNFLKTPSINNHHPETKVESSPDKASTSTTTRSIGKKLHTNFKPLESMISDDRRLSIHHRQRYAIASASSFSMRHANKRENLSKNTNQRYVPYDYNRVILRKDLFLEDVDFSDYINASHIDSLLKPKAYIAAQAPNENTIGDFWRMIWQENVHIIVMLTKVYEFIRVMCSPYWPSALDFPEVIESQFEVTLVDEDKLADYIVRTMKVRCLRPGTSCSKLPDKSIIDIERIEENRTVNCNTESEYRIIYQLHFVGWNINSCPYSDSILKFRRRVQIYEKQCRSLGTGSVLVHCSNGCGRTGTYICLDANLALAEEEGVVDIFNYAKALRKARVNMIDNLDQYKFIYDTIEESHVCGKTWFHVSEISLQMKHKSIKDEVTKKNNYQNEFEKLMRMTSKFSIGDCAGGHRLENRYKNRDASIVPPDNFRPYLTSFQCNEQTDYINAVFVDGYSRPREYIVTEWPLKRTISDIWSLIYDHDCNTVVVLGGVPPNSVKAFPEFWPKDSSKQVLYGPSFMVETISTNHPPNISSWVLRVNKKVTSLTELMAGIKAEPKITQVFEFGAWPFDYKVPISTNALVELIHMVDRWRQRTSYGPVLVVSANGKARVGVYCAANFAIEQVVAHEEIDIFNAVKTVRRHRSALIDTVMEYKYCYDLTLHYVSHYMNKGNQKQIFRKNI